MSDTDTINGIICVNKPQDFTSFDAVAIMRRAARTKKVGHGGTLDPMATGVLPIFIGRATKAADLNPDTDKAYNAAFRLGLSTDTEDIWGNVLSTDDRAVPYDALLSAAALMRGDIMQTPPMYSAVKIGGKKLYEIARRGEEIERPQRAVTIHELRVLSYDEHTREGRLHIRCSKGTYIRTLISDIGKALCCGAVMTELERTLSGSFSLDGCRDIRDFKQLDFDEVQKLVIPTERIFEKYKSVTLNEKQKAMFLNGAALNRDRMGLSCAEGELLRMKDTSGAFLGLCAASGNELKVKFMNILK